MSSYMVVRDVSRELRKVLWSEFMTDEVIAPIVSNENAIVFTNPTETVRDSANRLSLWLYQVTENEFLKNQPMRMGTNAKTQVFAPFALNLYYLVTPFAQSGEGDHLLLGKTMQVMYDNAILKMRNDADETAEDLRLTFCRLSLEELTRIWEALKEPYRLSVCYQVRVTRIDSNRAIAGSRTVRRDLGYGAHEERIQ